MNFDKFLSKRASGKKVCLLHEDPMLQRNNSTSPYSLRSRHVEGFCATQNTHSLTEIFQNPHFYPDYYIKEAKLS